MLRQKGLSGRGGAINDWNVEAVVGDESHGGLVVVRRGPPAGVQDVDASGRLREWDGSVDNRDVKPFHVAHGSGTISGEKGACAGDPAIVAVRRHAPLQSRFCPF